MLFEIEKEVKHSRRYKASDEDYPIETIYVKRFFANGRETLNIRIEEFDREEEE